MNTITIYAEKLVCSCGARAKNTPTERGRFLRRHPEKCSARQNFTKQIAATTKAVDADDEARERLKRWDAIENGLRAQRGLPPMEDDR